jgi:McbB family protein
MKTESYLLRAFQISDLGSTQLFIGPNGPFVIESASMQKFLRGLKLKLASAPQLILNREEFTSEILRADLDPAKAISFLNEQLNVVELLPVSTKAGSRTLTIYSDDEFIAAELARFYESFNKVHLAKSLKDLKTENQNHEEIFCVHLANYSPQKMKDILFTRNKRMNTFVLSSYAFLANVIFDNPYSRLHALPCHFCGWSWLKRNDGVTDFIDLIEESSSTEENVRSSQAIDRIDQMAILSNLRQRIDLFLGMQKQKVKSEELFMDSVYNLESRKLSHNIRIHASGCTCMCGVDSV